MKSPYTTYNRFFAAKNVLSLLHALNKFTFYYSTACQPDMYHPKYLMYST